MKSILPAIAWIILLMSLFACNTPSPTSAPPPTVTPLPPFPASFPSSTPVMIPSPAFTPPSRPLTPTPSAFAAALGKTQAAQKYRVALTLNVKQGAAPAFTLDLQGEVDRSDAHYAYQLGNDKIEFTTARGQFFVKGARSLGLPTTTKWYIVTPDLADAARPPFSPDDLLDDFTMQTAKLPFQSIARESLDGQNCQVWRYAPKTTTETGLSNALGADQDNSAFGALEQSEIKVWVCDDGAAHQLSLDITAHNPKQSTEKGTAKILLHIWDLENAAIKIDAPVGAEPFRLGNP
jgi:hypothetical protein